MKPIEKISIRELCDESGINRTTFYKHYQAPIQILYDMACDYAEQLQRIFEECMQKDPAGYEKAAESCCEYLWGKKEEIRILFSENAGRHLERIAVEIMGRMTGTPSGSGPEMDERRLFISASGMAAYGLLICWLTEDIQKTPHDIVMILNRLFGAGEEHFAFAHLMEQRT